MAIISSIQTAHRKKAEELYPEMMDACVKLIDLMKAELDRAD